jgi:phosphoglycolate phosphatase-like HAD superfamily hydrolase
VHVVWDWNGTLLDDLEIVVESVNASLGRLGAVPIDAAGYRAHYRRPVREFYESLLERPVDPETWRMIDDTFHAAYRVALGSAGLAPDARAAIEAVASAGATQSILSMWWHDELVPAVRGFGLDGDMVLVDGNRDEAGAPKTGRLPAHLRRLAELGVRARGRQVVLIGDITDDAEAAAASGVGCVLYDSGSQARRVLESAGVAVAATLLEAVASAGL